MSSISSGSVTIFQQSTALVGWSKLTTENDCMLRVVNGANTTVTANQPFTTVMTTRNLTGNISISGTVGSTVLTIDQMAGHSHADAFSSPLLSPQKFANTAPTTTAISAPTASPFTTGAVGNVGAGDGHSHPLSNSTSPTTVSNINFAVKYIDVILARRNY